MPKQITLDVCEELVGFLHDIGYPEDAPCVERHAVYRTLFDIVDEAMQRSVDRAWRTFRVIAMDVHEERCRELRSELFERLRRQLHHPQ